MSEFTLQMRSIIIYVRTAVDSEQRRISEWLMLRPEYSAHDHRSIPCRSSSNTDPTTPRCKQTALTLFCSTSAHKYQNNLKKPKSLNRSSYFALCTNERNTCQLRTCARALRRSRCSVSSCFSSQFFRVVFVPQCFELSYSMCAVGSLFIRVVDTTESN